MEKIVSSLFDTSKSKKEKKLHSKHISTKKRFNIRSYQSGKYFAVLLCLLSFWFANAYAESSADLHLSIDKTAGTTDDTFTLDVTLKKASDESYFSLDNMKIAGLNNFQIIGSNSATNVQIVNGSMAAVSERKFVLQPSREGEFTIGPAQLAGQNGEIIESESVKVSIEKSLTQKTKEALLQPLPQTKPKANSVTQPVAQPQPKLSPSTQSSSTENPQNDNKENLPSTKIQTVDYTNWFFWGQIFAGIILFLLGILVGKFIKK